MSDFPRLKTVRSHKHTCANVKPGSTYADKCDCGALDTAGNAIEIHDAVAGRIASLEHALLEIIGTADEYKAMPCDSLERRFFSTVDRYRSVVEKA